MKIAELLYRAANDHLCTGSEVYADSRDAGNWSKYPCKSGYSCDALLDVPGCNSGAIVDAEEFLTELGLYEGMYHAFEEFEPGDARQGARYLWLTFAAMIAAEEGL